jgi:putative multiple sugar transport system substrate-binding protein
VKMIKSTILGLMIGLIGVASHASAEDKGLVGISMPTKSSARWIADGDNMVKVFKEKGYKTDLQYAEDDIPNQLAQIENMMTKGVKVLVIASIDGTTLSDVLQKAADKGRAIALQSPCKLFWDSVNNMFFERHADATESPTILRKLT